MESNAVQSSKKWTFDDVGFLFALLLSLIPLAFTDFVVTSDGPCHFYNSKILIGWWFEGNFAFYSPFLKPNQYLDPNWITNIIQIPLLWVFSVPWTEKVFYGLYILVFCFGIRGILLQINPKAGYLSVFGALFVWNAILMKGFTNNDVYACGLLSWCLQAPRDFR